MENIGFFRFIPDKYSLTLNTSVSAHASIESVIQTNFNKEL